MPPVGFEPTISAGKRPQTHALDRTTTGTGLTTWLLAINNNQRYSNRWHYDITRVVGKHFASEVVTLGRDLLHVLNIHVGLARCLFFLFHSLERPHSVVHPFARCRREPLYIFLEVLHQMPT